MKSGLIDYLAESKKYMPQQVRTLLIAEAPPPSGKAYFYVPQLMSTKRPVEEDRSLPATIFYHYFRERPESTERYAELLLRLKEKGVFLIDIIEEPRKISDRTVKGGVIRENLDYLVSRIPELRQKIKSREITIEDKDIIFLLPRKHYKKLLDAEFKTSKKQSWIEFRMNTEES